MRTTQRITTAAAAALAITTFASTASAQDQFQVEQFEPLHAQGINILNVSTSDTLTHLAPSVGLFAHVQDDPYQVETTDGELRARLVDEQFRLELNAGIGLFDFLEVGLAAPFVLAQSGDASVLAGSDGFSGAAMGDLRIVPKARIVEFGDFGLAVLAPVWLPTGGKESFNSDGTLRAEPRLAFDWNPGDIVVATNLGLQLRPKREVVNYTSGTALRYGLAARVPIIDPMSVIASYHGAIGLTSGRDPANLMETAANAKANPMELTGGLQFDLPMNLVAQAGAGLGLTSSVGTPDFRLFAGLSYTPRGTDSDGDGVVDARDECVDVPEDRDRFEDRDGCPDPDNDADEILDVDDECPDEAEDIDGFEDTNGCPDPDNDGDGVLDVDDGCPDTPGEPDTGCPNIDTDGDGLFDPQDKCPNQPEDKDGFEDQDGCPDPDNDRDGILDADDQCPSEKETINGVEDTDGCPDEGESKVKMSEGRIEILEKVYFDLNKATIKQRSFNVLNQVALILKANAEITKVRVEGHTDSQGADDYNQELSQKRAQAVRAYLVTRGIDGDRLEAVGYGETKPIAENETKEGRETNRRVEFKILETNGKTVVREN